MDATSAPGRRSRPDQDADESLCRRISNPLPAHGSTLIDDEKKLSDAFAKVDPIVTEMIGRINQQLTRRQ